MIDDLLAAKTEADKTNRPYAVLHVVGKRGATPATVGKAMLVESDGRTSGTIGGGKK